MLLTASAVDVSLFLSVTVLAQCCLQPLLGVMSIPVYDHCIMIFSCRIIENGVGRDLQKTSTLFLCLEAKAALLKLFISSLILYG